MENEILLNKNKQIGARNVTNTLPVDVVSTSKPLIQKNLKEVVDLYDVYREEYGKCHKYRITLTIKPYCTNVLFNMCTEVVKDEGDENCQIVYDTNSSGVAVNDKSVYGEFNGLTRAYMVSNTEYSSPEIGYSYYPGYDMLDNHTLRNLSFRPVLFVTNSDINSTRERFNTLTDYMRTKDGSTILFYPRFSIGDVEDGNRTKMHIYEHSNLLSFIDGSSADANLSVENGWVGFKNNSSISEDDVNHDSHEFSHTINNESNCEFVDMFPDRTRYSFVPKYNQFRNRYEKNWDIFLTYPWKNFYNHNLVCNVKKLNNWTDANKQTFALTTFRVVRTRVSTNRRTMLFRTFCKHGLSVNDKIAVYLSKDYGNTYQRLAREYTVDYLGDKNGDNTAYFFGIASKTLVDDLFSGEIENLFYNTNVDHLTNYTFVDVSGDMTEVPDAYDRHAHVYRVYTYETGTNQGNYTPNQTFDSKPVTINEYSQVNIRVWNNSYDYYEWDGTDYNISPINTQITYCDWNTFTDKPSQYSVQSIRVKKYNYYRKDSTKYAMNTNLDVDGVINNQFENNGWHIRFVKVENGVDCKYYIRQFRKVPNLKFSSEELPEGIGKNEDGFLQFINKNASDNDGHMLSFDSETYRLAFAKTLYGDDVAQVTFLDTLDIQNLTDNLGRPVTEIYSTIVKRNKGYKEWYGLTEIGDYSDIEYSRCFGSLTTGLEYLDLDDAFDRNSDIWKIKGMMSDVGLLYRDSNDINEPKSLEQWDDTNSENEILETDDVFFGDVVEYSPSKCKETVLSDACFRFNTAQREIGRDGEGEDFDFTYHEILYDDFDPVSQVDGVSETKTKPFLVGEYHQWTQEKHLSENCELLVDTADKISVRRKEGYFYKPHTKIQLLKFSDMVYQGSHRTLRIKECSPLQAESIFVKITTATLHGVGNGSVLFICDGNNWIKTSVAYVIDNYRFAMSVIDKDDAARNGTPYIDWVTICKGLSSGTLQLRVANEEIPSYAKNIGENLFVWREVVNPNDLADSDSLKYPFANKSYYVDNQVNLYLRRQDPIGINGLFHSGNIPDITGKLLKEKNNEYKTEVDIQC